MLTVLYNFYKPICLVLLALLGLACGHLIDTFLQMKLRTETAAEIAIDRPAAPRSLKTTQADLNKILQNNLFDADNRSATATMIIANDTAQGNDAAATAVHAELKLFGTVVAAEQSQALLEVNGKLQLFHLGEDIPGNGTIKEVRRNQVVIRNRDQSLTTLALFEKEPLGSTTVSTGARTSGVNTDGDIREVGENRWVLSQNLVGSVRENIASQLRLAQMQPRLVDGKTDGFLIQRLNPRSILNKMGLKRGDVIIDVNSIQLDSPEKALQVFQQLREARQITVAVERRGQPMSFSYEIQ